MKNRFLAKFDYLLILAVLSLVTIGVLFIYSSSINSDGISVTNEHIKQIIWASIGTVLMVLITLYDYRRLQSSTFYLYIFLILLLVYTRIFGKYVNGAYSWIGFGSFGIQPSEFGKIFYILYLANFLYESRGEASEDQSDFLYANRNTSRVAYGEVSGSAQCPEGRDAAPPRRAPALQLQFACIPPSFEADRHAAGTALWPPSRDRGLAA